MNSYSFGLAILHFVRSRALVPGDILILDNARIHFTNEVQDLVFPFLRLIVVQIFFTVLFSGTQPVREHFFDDQVEG